MKILMIEDSPNDAVLAKRAISSQRVGEPMECETVGTLKEGLARLAQGGIDLVLTDLGLPDAKGVDAVSRLRKDFPKIPCVVLTGTFEEESFAKDAVRIGAQDYLFKEDLKEKHTMRSLWYAMERNQLLLRLEEKNREMERLNNTMLNREGRILELKEQLERLGGKPEGLK